VDTPPPVPAHLAARIGRALALIAGLAALIFTVGLVLAEAVWDRHNLSQPTPADAFVNGSIGTELAPLVAFDVLPELFPDEFHPIDRYRSQPIGTAGDWIDQYGFIRKSLAPPEPKPDGSPLPIGFVLSYHRPGSGAPSPIQFVGLSCAACHSAEIRTDVSKPGVVLYGVGNPTMNLLAFSEMVRFILVKRKDPADPKSDYLLTLAAVQDARAKKGQPLTVVESVVVQAWISGSRGETAAYEPVIDDPLPSEQLFSPKWIPAGPGRTQPFRSLVRVHLNRPGMSSNAAQPDQGFSKIPVIYHQDHTYHGDWAQFDGSVSSLVARSTLAASTAGANVNNLSLPDLAANIERAAEYTRFAGPPTWEQVFGSKLDPTKVAAGEAVYRSHCYRCHGGPDGKNGWEWTKYPTKAADYPWEDKASTATMRFGEVMSWKVLGTDPERVQFRHASEIPRAVTDEFVTNFRKDHPLGTFKMDQLRANTGDAAGYYNGPITGAFLRAPYLHNASILTLAELIGLEKRRAKFYRGRNPYDLERVGFQSPDVPKDVDYRNPVPHDNNYYFVFDSEIRGNSNRGHEYPDWGFQKDGKEPSAEQKKDLSNLLEYLKSL
jgi:hypothetical protein